MANLSGGALLMNRTKTSGRPDGTMDGFLDFVWHGAHDGGRGRNKDIFTSVPIAEDCRGGQFALYFCSTSCLRTFLNACVDALESKVKQMRNQKIPARLRGRKK